jgi:2'-5' RNA ligase
MVPAATQLTVSNRVIQGYNVPFLSHWGPKRFDTSLAMNLPYADVLNLRQQLNAHLGTELNFFTGWNPKGEAHITTITPVEYFDVLKEYLEIDRIEEIADRMDIQYAEVSVVGLGVGRAVLNGKEESTYFIVVESEELLAIRRKIHEEFVANGGDEDAFDPENFYPHITVGYTVRDLHEQDGVLKHGGTLDPRFELKILSK